jgi:hypothetical protein
MGDVRVDYRVKELDPCRHQNEKPTQSEKRCPMPGWNFADVWETVAELTPDASCQIQGDRRLTWGETDRRANGVARTLLDRGVAEQDKVAQYLYNCPEYIESMFAAFKAGLVPINTNYRYQDEELVYLWDNADCTAVVFHGTFTDTIERIRGWRDELTARRLEVIEPVHGDWTAASGFTLGLDLDVSPGNAVFVANDHMAIGVLSALRERDIRVPEDVSVVGFDDVPEAGFLVPPLTTVRQDFAALGELIMQKVLVTVEEPDHVTEDTPLATRLIVRQSTRAVDSPDASPGSVLRAPIRRR